MRFALVRRVVAISSLAGTGAAVFMWGFPKYLEYRKTKVRDYCDDALVFLYILSFLCLVFNMR